MSVKSLFTLRHRAPVAEDPLAINSRTWHQYYSTVQSDVYPHMLLEQAMERGQSRALQVRRPMPLRWMLGAALLVTGAGVWLML